MEAAVTGVDSIAQLEALLLTWDEEGNKSGILFDWPKAPWDEEL
jgi:hypothetical protein